MSPDESQSSLPEELLGRLPTTRDKVELHIYFAGATNGSMAGETHLALVQRHLYVFSRTSYSAPFKAQVLAPGEIPRLEQRGERKLLVMTSAQGEELLLLLTAKQRQRVQQLIVRMCGIPDEEEDEEDPEDAPTGVMAAAPVAPGPPAALPGQVPPGGKGAIPRPSGGTEPGGLPQGEGSGSLARTYVEPVPGIDPEDAPTEVMGSVLLPARPPGSLPRGGVSDTWVDTAVEPTPGADPEDAPTEVMESVLLSFRPAGPPPPMEGELPVGDEAAGPGQAAQVLPDDREIDDGIEVAEKQVGELRAESSLQPGPTSPGAAPAAVPRRRVKTVFSGADLHNRFHDHIHKDKDLDAAFCVADALVFMGKAKDGVRLFHQHHRPTTLQRTGRVIDEALWRAYLQAPGEDPEICLLMALISPAVIRAMAYPAKAFGLNPGDRRDIDSDLLQISRVFAYVRHTLGVGPAELYVQAEKPLGFLLANTGTVLSFVAGADLLQGRHQNELVFMVARQLALVKPEYILCNFLPSPVLLRQVVLAAIKLALPKLAIPKAEQASVGVTLRVLKQLPSRVKGQVRALVSRLTERQTGVDLDTWFFYVQLTADRAALLLGQDLYYAARLVNQAPLLPGGPDRGRRIQELVRFCLSKEYVTIRRLLGLSIGGQK